MRNSEEESAAHHELAIERIFEARRELVFRHWIEPENVSAWFAPDDFTVTRCEIDARPGGRWRVEYRSESGDTHVEHGEFHEIVAPERLVFSLTQQHRESGKSGPVTRVTVTFAEQGAKTAMSFLQTGFDSAARRDGNGEGWKDCFRKLDAHLHS